MLPGDYSMCSLKPRHTVFIFALFYRDMLCSSKVWGVIGPPCSSLDYSQWKQYDRTFHITVVWQSCLHMLWGSLLERPVRLLSCTDNQCRISMRRFWLRILLRDMSACLDSFWICWKFSLSICFGPVVKVEKHPQSLVTSVKCGLCSVYWGTTVGLIRSSSRFPDIQIFKAPFPGCMYSTWSFHRPIFSFLHLFFSSAASDESLSAYFFLPGILLSPVCRIGGCDHGFARWIPSYPG